MKLVATTSLLLCAALATSAQTTLPANTADRLTGYPFNSSAPSILKPTAGARVALIEFEDMECPHCAADAPAIRAAVAQYNAPGHEPLPYLRHDLPLYEIHPWAFDAAITARYLQDRVSPAVAEQFRLAVFRGQNGIASKDDLATFTHRWFHAHNIAQPFVLDSTGACRNEVAADRALADRMGMHGTPCVFVVTQKRWVMVTDMHQLYRAIDTAFAETASTPIAPRRTAAKMRQTP